MISNPESEINKIISKYIGKKDFILRILYELQNKYGFIKKEWLLMISDKLRYPVSKLMDIVSFYNFFILSSTKKNLIKIYYSPSCFVKNAKSIKIYLENHPDIKNYEIMYLHNENCIDSLCIEIGDKFFENVKLENISQIIKELI